MFVNWTQTASPCLPHATQITIDTRATDLRPIEIEGLPTSAADTLQRVTKIGQAQNREDSHLERLQEAPSLQLIFLGALLEARHQVPLPRPAMGEEGHSRAVVKLLPYEMRHR